MNALVSAAISVVGKALAPVADGLLETWGATRNLGPNIEDLRTELLLVKATLELAAGKHISGQAMEELLGKLRDSAHSADDLLDELDYFRIHDELHGTYDAADKHAKGGVHDLALNARHAAKAVGKRVSCCAWPRARHRSDANSSTPNVNQEVSGCMPKLGKLLPCSSSPHVHDGNSGAPEREPAQETPMLEFNRVDISERIKQIIEQLQPVHTGVTKILQSCEHMTAADIAQSRPVTTCQSIEPKLYGRDHIMNNIIHDMTKGKYHGKDLTVLPIVGPGGIGKTTMIQHIYHNKEVRNHFQVLIWVCVSLNFNLNKLLEDIKKDIPPVEGENGHRPEVLIEQRLKSKRFLLVLDDIWECSYEDDWKRLLLPLKTSQKEGSMILVTTRFPAIANMIETTNQIELKGLESEEFRKLFLAFVFGDETFRSDHSFLLETGDKIIEKLKGSPLAAKTVGALLRKNLNLRHWRGILESKEWGRQTGANDIMPALKLSYDYLPFHQQQCFSYSALFPEDHEYSDTELINLWIGLDILQPGGQNQTLEDKGLSNLNDLVTHGFFREEKTDGRLRYVMHDLLHDLALKVASHECLTLHHSNMRSVEIHQSTCHLSIIIDDNDTVSHENFKSQLRKLKERLKVKQLHTLIVFGEIDESFAKILGDLFSEANALRVLCLVDMSSSVESMLHNFSTLFHLRYLCLGTKNGCEMHLPLTISRYYHLRILDLGSWYHCRGLPKDLSNLAKLRHFCTPSGELHSHIYNVGKLRLLQELMVFRVNKESEGFEPKQLEHLTELRELGIYNLENIHTKEEADKAKLMEKSYLERLTLDWDSKRSNTEPGVEEAVLESLQPHRYLQELCIRGHGGSSCPTWLGDELAVEVLRSVHLSGVSWEHLPPLGKMWDLGKLVLEHIATVKEFVIEQTFCMLSRLELVGLESFEKWVPSQDAEHMFPLLQVLIIRGCPKLLELPFSNHIVYPKPEQDSNTDWFPKLQKVEIQNCPELLIVAHIPWTETLCSVSIHHVKQLEKFEYSKASYEGVRLEIVGKDGLQSLDQVLAFNKLTGLEYLDLSKCPPLEWKRLVMLTSLKTLCADSLDGVVGPSSGGEADVEVEWQHPVVQELSVVQGSLGGPSGKELTELLTHLPRLSDLAVISCKNITQVALAVGVDVQQTKSAATNKEEEDGMLLFPTHLSDSLRTLGFWDCPELVLVDPLSALLPAQGGGGGGGTLQKLYIVRCPKIFSAKSLFSSPSCCLLPSSLQMLFLEDAKGLGTLEPLSNLTFLTLLVLLHCGEDLRCKGLEPLLTAATGGQLRELVVRGSPGFFAGWDPNPTQVLLQDEGGEEQELQQLVTPPSSSKLQMLETDDAMGLLAVPICSLLSSSLTDLTLRGSYYREMERFTKEQEDALPLLASLQKLEFEKFNKLQSLPATLHKLTNLTQLYLHDCGEDLRCKGLEPLLTAGGQLRGLYVSGSPGFFAGWDPNPTQVLQLQDGGGEEQELQQLVSPLSSSKLQKLWTDDATGLLVVPICSLLSSSLTHLRLDGAYYREMERFTKEQEDALLLLASLQKLKFLEFNKLQSLPAALHKLTNLKVLRVLECPAVRSLPKDGLPKSLQALDVCICGNEELIQQCKGLVGTIPQIILSPED